MIGEGAKQRVKVLKIPDKKLSKTVGAQKAKLAQMELRIEAMEARPRGSRIHRPQAQHRAREFLSEDEDRRSGDRVRREQTAEGSGPFAKEGQKAEIAAEPAERGDGGGEAHEQQPRRRPRRAEAAQRLPPRSILCEQDVHMVTGDVTDV